MAKEQNKNEVNDKQEKIWPYITLITIFYVALGLFLLLNLVSAWPDANAPTSEVQMILIVAMAGALGSLVHGVRSLFWYVGNQVYAKSWTLMYFLIPFVGSLLSLVFYFVLRGGLFSPQATVEATSPFGFVGIAGLVGMFSNRAALKLEEIAGSLFRTEDPSSHKGKDDADDMIKTKKG